MARTAADALVVKPAGERAIRNRHHWLFSGAIASLPDVEDGTTVPVRNSKGELLGYAYFNRRCSLTARIVSFGDTPPLLAMRERLREALGMRERLLAEATNAYRIANGEGDGLPGLIVDRYGEVVVIQIGTLGLERMRAQVVELVQEVCRPAAIYERSDSPSRREEGLGPVEGWRSGEPIPYVDVHEDGLLFRVPIEHSQKTGFFLDQRTMRREIRALAPGRVVLDCFCYSGGFGLAALRGAAAAVDFVDVSRAAASLVRENLALNGFAEAEATVVTADAFEFLRDMAGGRYDLIVLDPPAFAKHRKDLAHASRAYRETNRIALEKVAAGGLLVTFSCSSHVDAILFQKLVFQAACEAGRFVRIVGRHRLAPDHPVNLFHPETEYLKGLVLYVS